MNVQPRFSNKDYSLGNLNPAVSSHGDRCVYLTPRSSILQRQMVTLFLEALDLALKRSARPAAMMARLLLLNRWLCGMRTHYRKSGGFTWPYLDGGRGYPVVLLHGYGADKDRFGSLVPFLKRRYRVVIPDIPGFGEHLPNWSASYIIHGCGHIPIIEYPVLFRRLYLDFLRGY